jgi:hypothetical protein
VATFQAEPFTVGVSDGVLADLRARIQRTRWPEAAPGVPWKQGTDLGYLRELLAYWAGGFDWRAQERCALDDPAPMLGIHLSNLDIAPYNGPGSRVAVTGRARLPGAVPAMAGG